MITLDPGEMAVAQTLATLRHFINRASKVSNTKIGPQSDYQTDLDGIVAELAFAKWKNCYPDLSVTPRSGGADMVINGKTIDIKATRYPNGKLLASVNKKISDADIYVLGIIQENMVNFVGWAYAYELLHPEHLEEFKAGKAYVLTQSQLRSFAAELT